MSTTATKPVSSNPFAGLRVCNPLRNAFDSPARATVKPDSRTLPMQPPRETGWVPYPTAA